jgi:hypothetical protein
MPFVAKVQFPWRLMIGVEFAGITALCLMPRPLRSPALASVFLVAIVALGPAVGEMAAGIVTRARASWTISDVPLELRQFLPARYPNPGRGYADLGLEPVERLPTIACAPQPRVCRATDLRFGELAVEIDAETPTAVTLRRFAFPYWRLDPALPLAATEPLQLVSFTAPAGRHAWFLRHGAVSAERIGWALSGAALMLLLVWTVLAWRRRAVSRP